MVFFIDVLFISYLDYTLGTCNYFALVTIGLISQGWIIICIDCALAYIAINKHINAAIVAYSLEVKEILKNIVSRNMAMDPNCHILLLIKNNTKLSSKTCCF